MKRNCPFCNYEIIEGADHCDGCLASFTHKDHLQPKKEVLQKDIITKPLSEFLYTKNPLIIVQRNTPVREVIEKLQGNPHHGCVVVCDHQNKLIGIVSLRDILHKIAGVISLEATSQYPVEKIMTPNPQSLPKSAPLAYALHNMAIGRYRHIPIVENGIPIGVVSIRDIIPYLSKR